MTTDTPRTCSYCGAFLLTHHTTAYCEQRTARQKAEAEVERLKVYLARAVEIAMIIWGDKTCDKPWPELRAELDQLKSTLNP